MLVCTFWNDFDISDPVINDVVRWSYCYSLLMVALFHNYHKLILRLNVLYYLD